MPPNSPNLRTLRRFLPGPRASFVFAIAEMTFVAWSSHRTWDGYAPGFTGGGNLVHVAIYSTLGALLGLASGAAQVPAEHCRIRLRRGVIGAVLFGLADEVHQYFVPGRSCSLIDILVDGFSAAGAAALLAVLLLPTPVSRRRDGLLAVIFLGLAIFLAWIGAHGLPGDDLLSRFLALFSAL